MFRGPTKESICYVNQNALHCIDTLEFVKKTEIKECIALSV